MAKYIVIIDNPETTSQVKAKLEEYYPDHIAHHTLDNIVFLRTDDIPEVVATKVGVDGADENVAGSVIKLNSSYYGFTRRGIWDWMGKDD